VLTYYGNVKSMLVLVGVGMMWAENVLYQVLRVYECRVVSSDHIFTQLRGLQYVVTHIRFPVQTQCKFILEM